MALPLLPALLAAALVGAAQSGAADPFARERQLLAMKVEARRVFPVRPLVDGDLDFVEAAIASADRCAAAGDRSGELAALTAAAQRLEGAPADGWSAAAWRLLPRLDASLLDDATTTTLRFDWLPAALEDRQLPAEPCAVEIWLARGALFGAGGELQRISTLARVDDVRLDAAAPLPPMPIEVPRSFFGAAFVTAQLLPAGGTPRRLAHPARIARRPGLVAEVGQLEERRRALLAATRGRPAGAEFDAALAVAALPAALLQQVARGDRQLAESLLELELRTAGESLAALERGSAPLPLPHGATRHVLDHPTTGELTPWLALAPAADGAGPRPLLVALHGLLAREESWLQYGDGALAREAARHGFIVVAPHGWRTDSFWVGHAETEVLALIDAACARWPIDRNRIALIGHSMGAMGALRLAAHHPDRFHAVAAIAGGGLPGWIRPLAGHSIMLAHGAADTVVPVALSRTLVASARATGAEWPLMELPDADHVSVVAATLPAVLDFLAAAPPRPSPGPPPARSDR